MKICALFVILLINLQQLYLLNTTNTSIVARKQTTKKTIVSLIYSKKGMHYDVDKATCRWLRGFTKLKRQCENRKGFAEVLRNARGLALDNCEDQFRYDRWNCTYKKTMFQKIYRETAFMYALSAAAIMYTAAKACSDGKLNNCYCAEQSRYAANGDWQWGGCGDNTRKARKIAKKLLHLTNEVDGPTAVLNHNTNIGFNTVKQNEIKNCVCHGLSGSCATRTCWKIIKPFNTIADKLKQQYHAAAKVTIGNQLNVKRGDNPKNRLLYLAQSPTFCEHTAGRRCRDFENCATLCCGRRHEQETVIVPKTCECRVQYVNVSCKTCDEKEDRFFCK